LFLTAGLKTQTLGYSHPKRIHFCPWLETRWCHPVQSLSIYRFVSS
jgi:hypothetical protein